MRIGCPRACDNLGCTMRAITSVPPPGGYGTTKRTGLTGSSCATACDPTAITQPAIKPSAAFIATASVAIRWVDAVELAQERGPFEHAEAPAGAGQIQAVRLHDDVLRRQLQLDVARERSHLDLASALEP